MQYTLRRIVRAAKIHFAHAGSLSMTLESNHPMKDIFPENKLVVY